MIIMKYIMFKIFRTGIVCAFFVGFCVRAGPTQISVAEKTFRNDLNYPDVHMTLMSIEDRLRNLENSLSVQCATAIKGKMDYYGRKIENMEKDLSRFQVHVRMELDKISENISSKNYKDDITKDRIIRKIDAVYERINHKLSSVEGVIDISSIKSQNTGEMIMTKLEKMEESLTVRDADMEAELADAVAAIDDLKTTCTSMEENILNVTKDTAKTFFKSNEKFIKKQYSQTINFIDSTNKSLSSGLTKLQETVNSLLHRTTNSSEVLKHTKDELEENLNEYENKIIDMYSDLWAKTDNLDNTVQNLAKVANLTRNEQQNGLRALMVQVGRKSSKDVQSDTSINNQKLEELSQKIDENFENVMLAQNLFLEGCHRIQMDESQLESQISIVLDKLIDVFENKTSVGPKDIEQLGHLIRNHDSNIRRSVYHITNNLLALMQKTTNSNGDIIDFINDQKLQLEAIFTLLQEVLNSSDDSERSQIILKALQSFQQQLNKTHQQTHTVLSEINSTNIFILKLLNISHNNSEVNSGRLQQTLEFIKNIYHILTSIEMKVNKSYLDYFFNKYNIDVIAHRFGKKLNEFIQSTEGINGSKVENKTHTNDEQQIPELIMEIFGENPTKVQFIDPYDDYPYTIEANVSKTFNVSEDEIENIVLLCSGGNASVSCDKINTTKYNVIKQNEDESTTSKANSSNVLANNCLPNYLDLIDVRSNSATNVTSNCNLTNVATYNLTNISKHPEKPLEKSENVTVKCLPNYIDKIDVRYDPEENIASNCTFTSTDATKENPNAGDDNTESYNIDVRYKTPSDKNQLEKISETDEPIRELSLESLSEEYSTSQEILTEASQSSTTLKFDGENIMEDEEAITVDNFLEEVQIHSIKKAEQNSSKGNDSLASVYQETSDKAVLVDDGFEMNFSNDSMVTSNEEEILMTDDYSEINPFQNQSALASNEENVTEEETLEGNLDLQEDDSSEINSEFEYTNHEYH